jgi:2-oxoglutarate ferredoxin oxidoreductase subunit alpha
MVDKVLRKMVSIKNDSMPPEIYGSRVYKSLIVCWGSTYHTVKEALDTMARDDVALLHCKQLFPLHPSVRESLNKAQKVIAVENNATGQFAELLRLHCGIEIYAKVLTYTGLPFAVEDVIQGLEKYLA